MPRLRLFDYLILILSLAVVVASVLWSASARDGELRVEIEASGERYLMALENDGHLDLEGPVGHTHVVVEDGAVFIEDSDCRDKICVHMGRVSTPSGWIACLPNRVIVRVVAVKPADDGTGVDAGAF